MGNKKIQIPDLQNENKFLGEKYGAVFLNEPISHDLVFTNCEIQLLEIHDKQSYKERSFDFINCRILEIKIHGSIFQLSFEDCEIETFWQSSKSYIELLFFNANSIDYKIKNLFFSEGKTINCVIEGYSVELFSTSNHFFTNVEIQDTANLNHLHSYASRFSSFYIYQIKEADFQFLENSEIKFYEAFADKISFKDTFINSSVTLYFTQVNELNFERLKSNNSSFFLENVAIKNNFKLVYSDLGQSQLIDCDLTNCNILIKASMLSQINSIRVNWPKGVIISDPDKKLTIERRVLEEMEFWRQLKINAITQRNQFNALLFYTREMDVKYLSCKSVPQKGRKRKAEKIAFWLINPIIDFFDIIYSCIRKRNAEGIMLWWHRYTSNFGIEWFRPTVIYFALSYFLFFIINDYSIILSFKLGILKDPKFYSFLIPVKNFDGETYMKASISLVASILQGLLIYQIIQGFRKYSFKS